MKRLRWHGLYTDRLASLDNDFINLGVDYEVKVLVHRPSAVNISVGAVRSPTGVTVNPLQPMLSTVTGDQVLKVICGGNTLRLSGAEKVFLDRICIVTKRYLDWSFEAVNVAIVARTLSKMLGQAHETG